MSVEKSGTGVGALHRVDQVEGVEVADKGQDGNDADRRQDEWKLDAPEGIPVVAPSTRAASTSSSGMPIKAA